MAPQWEAMEVLRGDVATTLETDATGTPPDHQRVEFPLEGSGAVLVDYREIDRSKLLERVRGVHTPAHTQDVDDPTLAGKF
jgi:hypothetical protein